MIEINKNNIKDLYHLTKRKIGTGISGNLYLCYNKLNKSKHVLKILPICKLSYNEIKIQQKLRSKYIINIVDVFKTKTKYYIILEYAEGGDLFDRIYNINMTEYNLKLLLYNISLLLKFIHCNNIIHSDIKLENVLIKDNSLKLCDFGFAKSLKSAKNNNNYYLYTLPYTSPEQLQLSKYDGKTDVWSLGIIAYYFYYSIYPFNFKDNEINNNNEIEKTINLFNNKQLSFDDNIKTISNEFKDLIQNMLKVNAKDRYNIDQVILFLEKDLSIENT